MKAITAVGELATTLYSQHLREGNSPNNYYVTLLGLKPQETHSLIGLVEKGFSFREVEHLRQNTRLSADEFYALVQINPRTLSRRKESSRLLPDESDRLLRASRVFGRTVDLFEGDVEGALRWLRASHKALGAETPLRLSRTEVGAREVERLIGQIEYGVYP